MDHDRNNATVAPNGPGGEVILDIEVAGAIAPGANIVVYFAPNTHAGFRDAVSMAAHDAKNFRRPSPRVTTAASLPLPEVRPASGSAVPMVRKSPTPYDQRHRSALDISSPVGRRHLYLASSEHQR